MLMRLIDADEVIVSNDLPFRATIRRVMEQQPTAYDVSDVLQSVLNAEKLIYENESYIKVSDAMKLIKEGVL